MKNKYKVPKKQWNKWNDKARTVFNEVFEAINGGYKTLWPNSTHSLKSGTIKVMAWNTAWIAADAANEDKPQKSHHITECPDCKAVLKIIGPDSGKFKLKFISHAR